MQEQEEQEENDKEDECVLCGKLWDPSCKGWPLCDACPNTCCKECASVLIVGEDFYCPECCNHPNQSTSAAAAVGGAISSAIRVCSEVSERLPLSAKAIQQILRNLLKDPTNPKYRKLRLRNPKVRELLDLDPCRRILTHVGFTETLLAKDDPVLILLEDTPVEASELQQLLDILEGLEAPIVAEKEEDETAINVEQQEESKKPAKRQKTLQDDSNE